MKRNFFLSSLFLASLSLAAAEIQDNSWKGHRIYGGALQYYYQQIFEENLKRYESVINQAKTKADALKIVRTAQARIKNSWRFPAEKCPLAPKVLKRARYGDVIVENVTFQSRKNFTVTANFYLPAQRTGKVPAVLFVQGHSNSGKRTGGYARACENLARRGIAVLSIDPIQQGERYQYAEESKLNCTVFHNRMNRQLTALGETFSDWRTYDGIRAVDYLFSRPEVDTCRIGINGQSGGGTMTALIFANDHRIMAAAPSCYITTFCHNVQNEVAADGEQMPARFLAAGGEMADLIIARAPQPYRIIAQKGDYFDLRGARKTYALAKKIYRLLGKKENISMVEIPGRHSYGQAGRLKAYEFFTAVFNLKNFPEEHKLSPKVLSLNCFGKEGIRSIPGEKTVRDLAKEQAVQLRLRRQKNPLPLKELRAKAADLLKVGDLAYLPPYRCLRMTEIDTKLFQRVGITPEKGITATLFYMDTGIDFELRVNKHAVLMLPHISAREELVKYFKKENARSLFALDPRGMGESESAAVDRFRRLYTDYGADYHFAALGLMLNQPYMGRRVFDILCAVNLLLANGAEKVTLRAYGNSRYLGIFAALLSDKKVDLELAGGLPVTYENAISDPLAPIPQSMVPYGILKFTDIDEICHALKGRVRTVK